MKQSRYRDKRMPSALRQAESGTSANGIHRKAVRSGETFYRWVMKFAGTSVAETRCLKELEEDDAKSKRRVGDLSFDRTRLRDTLQRKRRGVPGDVMS